MYTYVYKCTLSNVQYVHMKLDQKDLTKAQVRFSPKETSLEYCFILLFHAVGEY